VRRDNASRGAASRQKVSNTPRPQPRKFLAVRTPPCVFNDLGLALSPISGVLGQQCFPKYLQNIAQLIAGANESIEIICDFPAYGRFSDPGAFLSYRAQLDSKQQEGKEVQITCLDRERRREIAYNQFGGPTYWPQKKTSESFQKRLTAFLKSSKPSIDPADLDYNRFLDLIEAEDSWMLDHHLARARVNQVNRHIPVFFWIVDKKEAIFAIASLSDVEYGFYTRDTRLLTAFQDMRKTYLEDRMAGQSTIEPRA
jgi:hypothetical protein